MNGEGSIDPCLSNNSTLTLGYCSSVYGSNVRCKGGWLCCLLSTPIRHKEGPVA